MSSSPLPHDAPETDGLWYAAYPAGVPQQIDVTEYVSLVQYFDECTARYAERTAFISAGCHLSYARLAREADAFAAYLQASGIRPGDRFAIMLPNCFQYPIALFGALKAGAIVVNVNPLYTPRELAHQLKDSGAVGIVVFESFAHTLEQALPGTQIKHVLVTALGDLLAEGLNPKGRLINFVLKYVKKMVPAYTLPQARQLASALAERRGQKPPALAVSRDDLAFLQYTGGTTGVAKGAMLTHGNMIANLLQARAWMQDQFTDEIETILSPLPLYHIYSLTVNALIFLGKGGRNILIANPRDTVTMMKILRKETFTGITGINTLYSAFLDNPTFCQRDFSKLKLAMAGGMAMQRAVAERFQAVTGCPIVEGYGLTECSPIVSMNPFKVDKSGEFSGSVGLPAPSTEVRIRREDGSWAHCDEAGEVCVRGPQVMHGYWQRPDETIKVLDTEGWLATGDIGMLDRHGYLRLIDRKKDMILVSGFNVYPNEIEEVLVAHSQVSLAAVIGIPDPVTGERVKAYVVPRDANLTLEDLMAHCRKNLTGYKIPKDIEFRATLPQSNVGKILRRQLRDEAVAQAQVHA